MTTEIERIARLMCMANGDDPDAIVVTDRMWQSILGEQVVKFSGDACPLWQSYAERLRLFVSVLLDTAADMPHQDMYGYLQHILNGGEAPTVDEEWIGSEFPSPAPDWRYRYGLR